jgi:hypothetical protein
VAPTYHDHRIGEGRPAGPIDEGGPDQGRTVGRPLGTRVRNQNDR